jgi:hypothetical protein
MQLYAAFFDFCEATKDLATQPEGQQIHTLKRELFHALERATDQQTRSRDLELRLERLSAEMAERAREHQSYAVQATQELATARAIHHREVEDLRTEIRSLQDQQTSLHNYCESLLETMRRGVYEAAADDADVDPIANTVPAAPFAVPA